jgi:uncharacterized membrane protein (DUF2068 family)
MSLELQVYRISEESRIWTAIDWGIAILGFVWVIAYLISLVGVWRLKPWGRTIYTYSTVGIFLLLPFDVPTVSHPLTDAPVGG